MGLKTCTHKHPSHSIIAPKIRASAAAAVLTRQVTFVSASHLSDLGVTPVLAYDLKSISSKGSRERGHFRPSPGSGMKRLTKYGIPGALLSVRSHSNLVAFAPASAAEEELNQAV